MESVNFDTRVGMDDWRAKIGIEIGDQPLPTRMRIRSLRANLLARPVYSFPSSRIDGLMVLCLVPSFVLRVFRIRP